MKKEKRGKKDHICTGVRKKSRTMLKITIAWLAAIFTCLLSLSAEAGVYESSVQAAAGEAKAMTADSGMSAAKTVFSMIPQVDALDRAAHEAQLNGVLLTGDPSATLAGLLKAVNVYRQAEADLDTALDNAWSSVAVHPTAPAFIADPMVLAMLDLQIQVRRTLGPAWHTVVPGLTEDRGCEGDIVAERLIYAYGAEVSGPAGAASDTTLDILDRIARQIVCIGAKQLAELEYAVAEGYKDVTDHMAYHGLGSMVPSFTRLLAPVQVLVLDARKHRGENSLSWQWFRDNKDIISEDVALAGWATEELIVWDRREGRLVGFAQCTDGLAGPDCVDFRTFMESMSDPRALGLGDCAFAGMISRGTDRLGKSERYACPSLECGSVSSGNTLSGGSPLSAVTFASAGGTAMPAGLEQQLLSTWTLSSGDIDQMAGICNDSRFDLQGLNIEREGCEDPDPDANNPFEQYTACIVETTDTGSLPRIGGTLQGVPMGLNCGLSDGFMEWTRDLGTTRSGTNVDPETGEYINEPKEPNQTEQEDPKQTNPADQQSKNPNEPTTEELLAEGNQWIQKNGTWVRYVVDEITGEITEVEVRGNHNDAADAVLEKAKQGYNPIYTDLLIGIELDRLKKQGQDCIDPGACSNECSGVGQQISEMMACEEGLLDGIAKALGKADKKDLSRRVDLVSNPDPESDAGVDQSGSAPCLGSQTDQRAPAYCGLILCGNGFAARESDGTCGCDDSIGFGAFRLVDLCLELRCPDGQMPDQDCRCGSVESYEGRPPQPPVDPALESVKVISAVTALEGSNTMSTQGNVSIFTMERETCFK